MVAKKRFAEIGVLKKSTNNIVDDSLAQQAALRADERRRRPKHIPVHKKSGALKPAAKVAAKKKSKFWTTVRAYWFPILCIVIIIVFGLWALCPRHNSTPAAVPEPVVRNITDDAATTALPAFDMVRVDKDGKMIIAGRAAADTGVSVIINKKIAATISADKNGEFVYAPAKNFAAGNYTLRLITTDGIKSTDDVFVYIAADGWEKSVSLLMTADGSKILQAPKISDGDLVVSQIDYLENGRIVVQGAATPRLRVSLSLDDAQLGTRIVSDHKNFGLGAKINPIAAGEKHTIAVRLHDGAGLVVAEIAHEFNMPAMTPGDATFYTVRRDDSLWVISRNFLGRGARYTLIATENKIANPHLIFPKQKLKIPVTKEK